MPNDSLKNRERFSTTLDKNVAKELKNFSKDTMIPISKILDMAISDYIKNKRGLQK